MAIWRAGGRLGSGCSHIMNESATLRERLIDRPEWRG
jgi:hypothetical protein